MSDMKIIWEEELMQGDISFEKEDFVRESGLETAVILSLFLDRRADDDDDLDDINDKKGWWGDLLEEDDQIGSKLWLLDRAKTTQETINAAKEYAQDALEWMVDDGVVAGVEVEVTREGTATTPILIISVELKKKDGTIEVYEFDDLWNAQVA